MAEYRISLAAEADLAGIFAYSIEQFGEDQAERYKGDLQQCIQRIAVRPGLGRPVPGRTRVFYRYNCRSHAIYFSRFTDESVLIVRALHQAMDSPRHLPRP